MTDTERMIAGKLYDPYKAESQWMAVRGAVKEFNDSFFWQSQDALDHLKTFFGRVGENVVLTPPFYCDHGDKIRIGSHFYANTGLTILDENYVTIGNHVYFGPHVSIYTASHPIDTAVRKAGLEYAKPVTIGDDVWIGGNTTVNPGIFIGSNVVIGSGSTVTKDIPSGVVAAGNPCRIIREITEEDSAYWKNELQDYMQDDESTLREGDDSD